MNYRAIYDALIAYRLATPVSGYSERHHVVPRAMGGSDTCENIVRLTGREHFVAHALLARIYGGPMWLPVIRMKNRRGSEPYVNSRIYEAARFAWADWSSKNQRGENHWAYGKTGWSKGKKFPDRSGEHHPLYGTKRTAAQIDAVRMANTGSRRSEESRLKMSLAQRGENNHQFGKKKDDAMRAQISASLKGRKQAEEHIKKRADARRGRKVSDETKEKLRAAWVRRREKAGG